MMAKVKAVKWAIGADEPEDLQEFLSNDEIVAKHTDKKTKIVDWPGKGPWTFKVQFVKKAAIAGGENKGKPRLRIMMVLAEPKDSEAAKWNGYAIFDGFNVTDQGTPYLKRWLKSLGLKWDDFYSKTKEDDSTDPPQIVQIGKVKFNGAKDVTLKATVVVKPPDDYNDDYHLEIGRFLPKAGMDDGDGEADDAGEDETGITTMGDDAGEPDEPSDDLTPDKLNAMKVKDLKALAVESGVKQKKVDAAGKDKAALVDLISKKLNLPPF